MVSLQVGCWLLAGQRTHHLIRRALASGPKRLRSVATGVSTWNLREPGSGLRAVAWAWERCSKPAQGLSLEHSCASPQDPRQRAPHQAPVRLSGSGIQRGPKTLAVRYRRSPEGCFESGLVVPEGRGAPPWRDAPACELRRSRVPWSRCTFFALEVMTDPVAASAAPPERLKPCSPKTPLLPAVSIPAASRPPIAPGPACRAPLAPPASDPTPPAAPSPDPTVPPTVPVVRPSKPPRRLMPAPPAAPIIALASPALLPALASAAATAWIPTLRSGISCPSRVTTLSKTIHIDEPA